MKTEKLTMSFKCKIGKPLNQSWDVVSPRLRELCWLGHRVLNGVITRLALANAHPELVPVTWKSKLNPNSEKRPGGKPQAYQMAVQAILEANQERVKVRTCVWCGGTGVEPTTAPTRANGKAIPRTKAQEKHARAPGEVCTRCDGQKEYRTGDRIEVPSPIQLGWARAAERRYLTDKVDIAMGKKALSTYRSPAPIVFSSSSELFTIDKDPRGYCVTAPLYPGGRQGCVTFALAPDGPNAFQHLRRLTEEPVKLGDLKIKADGTRWLAIISYTWEKEIPAAQSGPHAVLTLTEDNTPVLLVADRKPKKLYEGSSLLHKRQRFAKRRASRSRHQRDIAPGARGHGRARTFEHYHKVDDAESRWLKSLCQEIAAKAAKEAALRGCRWVVVDEKIEIIPLAKLKEAVKWALTKRGFQEPREFKKTSASSESSEEKEASL